MFEFNLIQLANYLYSHRWWIIIVTAICVTATTLWVVLVKRPVYRASVAINIDLFAEEKGGANAFSSPFFMQDQMVANKIGLTEQYFDSSEFRTFLLHTMLEGTVPENLKVDLEVVKLELEKEKMPLDDDAAAWLVSKIDMKGQAEKSRIDLFGSARIPSLAASIANVGSFALVEYNRQMLLQRLKTLKGFLNVQTSGTKRELHMLEEQLVALQKRARIISPDEIRARVNSLQVDQEAKLIEFDRQYASLNTLIIETEADLKYFKNLMQENKPASYLYIEQIQRRLEVLRYEKSQNGDLNSSIDRGVAAANEPVVDENIKGIVKELGKELQSMDPVSASPWDYVKRIEGALFDLKQKRSQAKSEALAQETALKRTNNQFIGLPESLKKMSEVKRNIDLTTSLYTALMSRLQDTQIKEAAHSNDLTVVSSADAPGLPSGLGRSKTVLLSLLGGLILACLPLFLKFVLLPTIRNMKDLVHLGVPIVGAIGWHRLGSSRPTWTLKKERAPRILHEAPSSLEANALRFARFQIEQSLQIRAYQAGQASRLLLVGSVNPKEGRSFVAANLADLFSTSGVRTCLIDLDFSNPHVADYFPEAQVEESPMTELFPPSCQFELLRVNDQLTILRPKPNASTMSEVLETRDFEAALNALEVLFELIIADTPPIVGHMEAVIAAQYADAFLLVINQRRTLRTEAEEAIRIVQGSLSIPIFGIMNFIFDDVAQARQRAKKIARAQRKPRELGKSA